jgi:carbonic anhydrase
MTSSIDLLLQNNRQWAAHMVTSRPDFFTTLLAQQNPRYMWVGCSDSRVPANEILLLAPGEVFVHRNIANVVVHSDLNVLSTIQFSVEKLKVEDILVVGHYGCAGVLSALTNSRIGLADNWIQHVRDVIHKHKKLLAAIADEHRANASCELNIIEQTVHVIRSTVLQDAWNKQQTVCVHALVYALSDGLLRPLGLSISNPDDMDEQYQLALEDLCRRYHVSIEGR